MTAGWKAPTTSAADDDLAAVWTLLETPEWHSRAACKQHDPNMFFPERGQNARGARAVCAGCPVRAECADAGELEAEGVWGGMTSSQRDRNRRYRRIA
jgi:WhiB family redox-sensing transcriptional regulator